MNMILHNRTTPEELSEGNVLLEETFADAVIQFTQDHSIKLSSVDVLGSPWATDLVGIDARGNQVKSALTMAEGSTLAGRTGFTAGTNFRISHQASSSTRCTTHRFLRGSSSAPSREVTRLLESRKYCERLLRLVRQPRRGPMLRLRYWSWKLLH
jgi:hypothetical protein